MSSEDSSKKEERVGMRNVYAMGIVSMFTDLSTEMILGLLPLFIVTNLGATKAALGTIEGSAELVSYGSRMVSGPLSDRMGRRKALVILGYVISTVSKPFFAATHGWLDAFAVRASDRVGKGIRTPPRDALIADSVPAMMAGKAFGYHRALDNIGAVVGPIVAFALLQVMDVRGVFLMSLVPGAISVVVLSLVVKEIAIKSRVKRTMLSNVSGVLKDNRPFVLLLVISAIFGAGAFNYSFVLLKASNLGVANNFVPLVYATINVTYILVSIPSGLLADRIGREKVLLMGFGVFGLSSVLMIILSGDYLFGYLIGAVFGVYMGISDTVQRAVVRGYVSSELLATAFGLFSLVLGLSFFAGNVIFGFLWDHYHLVSAIAYSVALTSVAIGSMIVFLKKYPAIKHGL